MRFCITYVHILDITRCRKQCLAEGLQFGAKMFVYEEGHAATVLRIHHGVRTP
jgi:hypothetical protein